MPGPIQGLIFIESSGSGWVESYWMQATDYTTALNDLDAVCSNRVGLSPVGVKFVNLRVSDVTVRGDSLSKVPTGTAGTFATGTPVDPDIALRIKQQAGPPARSTRYLRGMPDVVFTFNPITYVPGHVTFTANLANYFAYLSSKTQHVHRTAGTPPVYTTSAWTVFVANGATIRKAGRPFGLPVGRRVRA
jgi:hypothetical protein